MDFEIRTGSGAEIEIFADLPDDLKDLSKLPAHCMRLGGDWGTARFLHYQGNGFLISFNDYHVTKGDVLTARRDAHVLELSISLGEPIIGKWEGIPEPILEQNQFNLRYTPHVKTNVIFQAGASHRSFDIHFEKDFLIEMARDFPLLDDFMGRVVKGEEPVELGVLRSGRSLPRRRLPGSAGLYCSPEMLAAIQFIRENVYSQRAQERLVRSKVEEILIGALERTEYLTQRPEVIEVKLSATDKESLQQVKFYIDTHLDEMPSLVELARMSALNRDKLKKGFKKLFGVSVYEYHLQVKMDAAKRLLRDTDKTIWEIAYMLGYQTDASFCIAFRREVGCTAGFYRKGGKV